jgi:translation initiation factor IF-2
LDGSQARRRRRQERALARLGPGAGRAEAQRAGRRWDARLAAASGGSWRRASWRPSQGGARAARRERSPRRRALAQAGGGATAAGAGPRRAGGAAQSACRSRASAGATQPELALGGARPGRAQGGGA